MTPRKKLFHVPAVKNVPRVLLHKEIHLHFQEWINFIFLLTPPLLFIKFVRDLGVASFPVIYKASSFEFPKWREWAFSWREWGEREIQMKTFLRPNMSVKKVRENCLCTCRVPPPFLSTHGWAPKHPTDGGKNKKAAAMAKKEGGKGKRLGHGCSSENWPLEPKTYARGEPFNTLVTRRERRITDDSMVLFPPRPGAIKRGRAKSGTF